MALTPYNLLPFLLITFITHVLSSPSIIQMNTEQMKRGVDLYCESWRFTVETNNAGNWSKVPEKCVDFVKDYITGEIYSFESEAVSDCSLAYAKSVELSNNGKDAWVFDIDETLLSNAAYFLDLGFGSEIFDDATFDKQVDLPDQPALPASLRLYKEIQRLGFTIILLTGRDEFRRNVTGASLGIPIGKDFS